MRADRLVAALLVLQARGRVTAAELATELEVSERTARRDLEALAMSGVPVYSQAGRGGGWQLIGGARTDLTGLTAHEATALFLLAGPQANATPQVKDALRKLVRALPETFRKGAEAAASAVVIDANSWDRVGAKTPEHLPALQQAVVAGVQVELAYRSRGGSVSSRRVHPLGLVIKGTTWYLVAGTDDGQRTFRVDRVASVEATDDPVDRPDGFDLAETWRETSARIDERRAPLKVRVVTDREAYGWLRGTWGSRARIVGEREDGRLDVELRGYAPQQVAIELAGFGSRIEVDDPEVRAYLAKIGADLVARYTAH
ncbi:MAG: WYL domain-containing protein [Actinomycetota bacterium]